MAPAPIALDVMGGDHGPGEVIAGGVAAARDDGASVILVGRASLIEAELARLGAGASAVEVVDAPDVIGMDESPLTAVRAKPESSIVVAVGLVRSGRARGFVSPGNSGAVMAAAVFGMGRIRGVERPALATLFPTLQGRCLLVDVGANTDCKAEQLRQFGVMGGIYYELMFDQPRPRIGLLSNGEEEGKGNAAVREAFHLLRSSQLNFVGNVEGKDIAHHLADVVVMDGFVGNVTLKVAEGTSAFVQQLLREEAKRTPLGILGGLLLKPTIGRMRRRTDWQEFGGAPLLGVDGVCAVAHGRSDARAIRSAVRVARHAAEAGLPDAIRRGLQVSAPLPLAQGASGT
jgi:glycerol-3-phosphate acyltransferase PlsX